MDTVEQALLWHQDGNDLMFYVVFKGLKDCMTYNNRERKINRVYLVVRLGSVFFSVVWSSWCQVDRLCHWAAPLSLHQINHYFTLGCHS